MREYEDPEKYRKQHIEQSAKKYMHGLQKAGLKPNPTLTRAVAERAVEEAHTSYVQEAHAIRDHNVKIILKDHKKRVRQIRRSTHKRRLFCCLMIALFFAFLSWYNVSQGGFGEGVIYAIGSLSFLAMVVFG